MKGGAASSQSRDQIIKYLELAINIHIIPKLPQLRLRSLFLHNKFSLHWIVHDSAPSINLRDRYTKHSPSPHKSASLASPHQARAKESYKIHSRDLQTSHQARSRFLLIIIPREAWHDAIKCSRRNFWWYIWESEWSRRCTEVCGFERACLCINIKM